MECPTSKRCSFRLYIGCVVCTVCLNHLGTQESHPVGTSLPPLFCSPGDRAARSPESCWLPSVLGALGHTRQRSLCPSGAQLHLRLGPPGGRALHPLLLGVSHVGRVGDSVQMWGRSRPLLLAVISSPTSAAPFSGETLGVGHVCLASRIVVLNLLYAMTL